MMKAQVPQTPPEIRVAIVMENCRPHLSTKADTRVGD
jgi:hypothetical protein